MRLLGWTIAAALLGGCATMSDSDEIEVAKPADTNRVRTASELGRRYWRTKFEEDRAAWLDALDREGHDFSKRYKSTVSPRGIYKFNRESRLAYFIVNEQIAKTLGQDSLVLTTRDGCVRFDWKRLEDGTVDYHYSAPTNWEVYVSAVGEKPKCNPIKEANIHFGTALPNVGQIGLEMAHHREAWKGGMYADVPFPTNEIAAANNFIFGLRDGFKRLGFGEKGSVDGFIYLCTFDSNFPGGHTDFPAHFHISMNCRDGDQLHHFYMDPATGRVTSDCYQDMSNVLNVWDHITTFLPGDEFPAYNGHGRVAYRVKLLDDGQGFELSLPDRSVRCRVASPSPKDYVEVLLPEGDGWKAVSRIKVEDYPDEGVMRTPEGEIRYDPKNGRKSE